MSKRVFILTDIMRSSKTGYFIEGTDIAMDFPDAYPLPMETEVLENDVPVALRVLPHCSYLEKEKQLKNGFPSIYHWNDADRERLTFRHRRLEIDDKRDKIYLEYLTRVGWLEGNEAKKTRGTTKTIFVEYDEDRVIDGHIADEAAVTKAKGLVFDLGDSELRNLYRLSSPGTNRNDGLVKLNIMRKHLLSICNVNPGFILNGIKSNRDKLIVTVSTAIENGILSLDYPGAVAIFNPAQNEWQQLISVNDAGGPDDKFDRLVEYLQTEQGTTDLQIIEGRLAVLQPHVVEEETN